MAREMKESGIEWIGEIPNDWEIKPLKALLAERKENNNPVKTDFILSLTNDRGVIPYTQKGDLGNKSKEDLTGYKLAYPNDIVLNSMNVIIGSVGLSQYFGCVSPVYYMLYPRNSSLDNVRFYNYIFQTENFQKSLKGHGNGILEIRMRIPMSKLNTVQLPVTNITTQQRISDYLDEKCGEIDAIIEKTKATIEEYKKLKQSVITEAVTKGLNPDVEMKDSSIEWIGEIPKHWSIRKIKYILSVLQREILPTDRIITCFRNGDVTLRDNKKPDGYTVSDTEHGYQGVDVGDLVIHGMDAFAGAIGISDARGKCTPVVHVCESRECKLYIVYLLRAMAFNDVLMCLSEGIRIRSSDYRNWNKLAKIVTQVPPLEEQEQIANYLYRRCTEIDNLISKKEAILSELESYKKSLIYECVTGKKDLAVTEKASVAHAPIIFIDEARRLRAQTALMTKALDEGYTKKKYGRTEWFKTLYLLDACVGFPLKSAYIRGEYGPILATNNECENIICRQNKWFTKLNQTPIKYVPTKNKDNYISEYESFFSSVSNEIEEMLKKLNPLSMNEVEKIATLYAVWNDFILDGKSYSDNDIVNDVLSNWSNRKGNFSRENWHNTLEQMRKLDIVPKGYGMHTIRR